MARSASRVRLAANPRAVKYVVLMTLAGLIVVGVLLYRGPEADLAEVDLALCPLSVDELAGHVVLLLDLDKPLGEHATLPGKMIERLMRSMDGQTQLRVMALEGSATAPRLLVGRLCKPFSNDQLTVTAAKDGFEPLRDCDNLPAQLPPGTRAMAGEFCRRRDELIDRVTGLARASGATPVADVHLIEGIEESLLELADTPAPALHLLSDMIQHTPWYSHAERPPSDWTMAALAEARQQPDAPFTVDIPVVDGLTVTIHYMAWQGLTDGRRVAAQHQTFWRDYFGNSAETVIIEPQPVTLAYEAAPYGPTAAELAAAEAERLRREREQAAQLRERVAAEATALEASRQAAEQAQQEAVAAQRAADERAAQLARQADELEAEAARLQAERKELVRRQRDSLQADAAPAEAEVAEASEPASPNATLPDGPAEPAPVAAPDELASAPSSPPVPVQASPELAVEPDPPADDSPDGDDPVGPLCAVTLTSEIPDDLYPPPLSSWLRRRGQRIDYGSADIVVDYVIDDEGRTTEVALNERESRAEDPRYLNLFAMVAVDTVSEWTYVFEATDDCQRTRASSTRLQFRYR